MTTPKKDRAGVWLITGASVLLVGLAATQGLVSYFAQQGFVDSVKHDVTASTLEALGLDAGSVIFALLALALARVGRKAIAERFLNVACAVGSLTMNVMSAERGDVKAIAVYALPALLYIAASDRLIAAIRLRALAGRENVDKTSPMKILRTIGLWALRLPLAPWSTLRALRERVLAATDIGDLHVVSEPHDEQEETPDANQFLDEVFELDELPTHAARVRAAVSALGDPTPPEVYEWLTTRDQGVPMSSINSTLSRDRKSTKEIEQTREGLADEAIHAEPKAPLPIPPGQGRLMRA